MAFVPTIDFISPAKREGARLAAKIGLVDAPDLSMNEYWLVKIAYRKDRTFLIFDCEQTRDYGVDVRFGAGERKACSFHTFLRLRDSDAAYALGGCLPKDQSDMDALLHLYVEYLLKHRQEVFEQTETTIISMDRDLRVKNPPFNPVGRFCR
jgi:hypothetical protein